ncbi:MAG: DMT family transporter [Deltaproteobacteria bacterium]|nr:DMT family transporter [Deltaproteobacteria bacterium]
MGSLEPHISLQTRAMGVALVNLATMCWSTNAVLGRWLRADVGPLTLTTLRFTAVTAFVAILLRGMPPAERRYGKDTWWRLAMGLSGVIGFSPLIYLGLRYSTAVNAVLIQGFSPLITALIAGVIIQEPVTRRQTLGAVLGLIGVAGLISRGSPMFLLHLQFNPGDLILLGAAVLWAFYSVFGRRVMRTRSPVAATALSNFLSLPILVAAALFEIQHIPLNLRVETVSAIIHICIVPTFIGYWAWNRAVRTLGAGGAMVFYNTLPLYGVILGATLLGEPLGAVHLVFGGLILGGGLWATLGKETG